MSEKQNNKYDFQVTPDMLWNKWSMVQQLIVFVFLLSVYTGVVLVLHHSTVNIYVLRRWYDGVVGLFISEQWYWDIVRGVIIGTILSQLLFGLDIFLAWIFRWDITQWIHRADHLLPITKNQKMWAALLSVVGSIQEEILFRGYILFMILPIWTHWIWAVLILSTIFALFHAGVQGFWACVWIFITSIILCVSVAVGKSIYFVIAIHVMININNTLLIPMIYYKKH